MRQVPERLRVTSPATICRRLLPPVIPRSTELQGHLPEPERPTPPCQAVVPRCLDCSSAALTRSGRLSRAIYVERATMGNAVIMPLAKKRDDIAPYFAIVLVPGWEHAS